MTQKKLLVVQVAALGHNFLTGEVGSELKGLTFRPLETVFPALTCTAQASFRTALAPSGHGMVANGFYDRDFRRVLFWEQSSALVRGSRIWDSFRSSGNRVGMLFWQQSLGENVDLVLSPAPIHKHHGGMIPVCYSRPEGLYERLCAAVGREFSLAEYWGPLASPRAGDWIAAAASSLLSDSELAPELCLVYLPTLDYDLQRAGVNDERGLLALEALVGQLKLLVDAASIGDYETLIFGDYAMGEVTTGAVYLNRVFREAGLMATRRIKHMLYPDFYASRAFAVADHEVAHVIVPSPADVESVREILSAVEGVAEVLDRSAQAGCGLDHPRSGELVLVAAEGAWFAYPWWKKKREAPEYARHVDIHNKPGFDPCELFFGRLPTQVSTDPSRIKGSHGRVGPGRSATWASTCSFTQEPKTLIELAAAVRSWLEG